MRQHKGTWKDAGYAVAPHARRKGASQPRWSATHGEMSIEMSARGRWRRYLPRLKGLKNDYSNAPQKDAD